MAFTPIGRPRRLPYPLYYQISNGNVTDDAGMTLNEFVWPEDPEERTILPLWISQREFTALGSAIDVGADIAFPQQYIEVMWILLRNTRYGVDLCALIAQCITDSEETRQAIRDLVLSDPEVQQYITDTAEQSALSAVNRAQNLLKPDQCDPAYIFNQTSVLVQLLHDLTEDLFEAVEVGTNALERASIITSGIPVFGQVVPADELLQFADQLIEEVQEDYIGAYDEALFDTIRCALFCLVKDDCTLSIDRAIQYYEGALSEAFPDDPWEALKAIIGFLNVGDFGTDTPVYAMHLLVLSLIRMTSNVFGVDFGIMALRVLAAGDEPDNDWEILCEECAEPPLEDCVSFVGSEGEFTAWLHPISGLAAATHTPEGWDTGYNAGFSAITRDFEGQDIVSVEITLAEPTPTDTNVVVQVKNLDLTGGADNTTQGLSVYTFTGLSISDGLYINVQTDAAWSPTQRIVGVCWVFATP